VRRYEAFLYLYGSFAVADNIRYQCQFIYKNEIIFNSTYVNKKDIDYRTILCDMQQFNWNRLQDNEQFIVVLFQTIVSEHEIIVNKCSSFYNTSIEIRYSEHLRWRYSDTTVSDGSIQLDPYEAVVTFQINTEKKSNCYN
jgi:hypothetical protein